MAKRRKKRNRRNKKSKYYVKNSELLKEIIESKEQGELTPDAVEMLMKICNHAVNDLSYKYEEDREDSIATAIMKCVLYWDRFDPEKSRNAFAYFSQIAKNGYAESFNKLRPQKSANIVHFSDEQIHLF